MSLVRAITRIGALLLTITVVGCSSDDAHDVVLGVGGSIGTQTSTGGSTVNIASTGGATTGGLGSVGSTAASSLTGGGSSIDVGGASAATTQATGGSTNSTGGAPSTVVATGGVGNATGGSPATGGASVITTTAPPTYGISGTVTGLLGTGLKLSLNAGTSLAIAADGTFAFPSKLVAGSSVAVTVATQPTGPQQTCTVSASGTIQSLASDVTNVQVTCITNAFTVGGTATGLNGSGLTLQNNAGDDVVVTAVSGTGSFVFPIAIASGKTFNVTIKSQPTLPTQTCSLSGGYGTVTAGNITSVAINCTTNAYTISGMVAGLEGSGLELQNNGADAQTIASNGSFAFSQPVLSGAPFAVTVKTQPSTPAQTCTVTSGTGTVASGNVETVVVTCVVNTYLVKGKVSGLAGSGLTLQNNLGDNLTVASNGTDSVDFSFLTPVKSGGVYSVTVSGQPVAPTQVCTVGYGSGNVTNANITTVAVNCVTSSFHVGGSVTGLTSVGGTGLVLTNNGGDDVTMDADGTFGFTTAVLSGTTFSVKIKTQPLTGACSLVGGYGTIGGADVSSVIVNCSDQAHLVSGTLSGLVGTGLLLSLNGNAPEAISANGSFGFSDAVAKDSTYQVTVATQPSNPWQTCTITNGSGTMGTVDVSDVEVTCTINSYAVGGTVTGLAGSGLILQNLAGEELPISGTGNVPFAFPTAILSGQPYSVTVKTNPTSPLQSCDVLYSGGTVAGAAITNIQVNCTTTRYSISGTISGLVGTVVLADNTTDTLTLTANGQFTFATTVASGDNYNVEVKTQPNAPSQTCTVTGGTGPVVDTAIGGVVVTCVTNQFKIGGTVTGLADGQQLVLQNKGGDNLTITTNAAFAFATPITSGDTFAVTLLSGPTSQQCAITAGSGTVGASDVTGVLVNCSTKRSIGGTISGLAGTGLKLKNGTEEIAIASGSTSFAFVTSQFDGSSYAVTVTGQPSELSQTCTIATGTGTGTVSGNVTSIVVNCATNPYHVGVSVTGLTGSGLLLHNGTDDLPVSGSSGTFPTAILSGGSYNVTVATQPSSPSQVCTVTSGSGTIGSADVLLAVTCVTTTYYVGGTITGYVGTGVTLQNNSGDTLNVNATGTFHFATKLPPGADYNVGVTTNPAVNVNCAVFRGKGKVGSGDVTNISISCPGYDFSYNTQGWWLNNAPTGSTLTWSDTEGTPDAGAVVAYLPFTDTCPSYLNISVTPTNPPFLNVNLLTKMSVWIRVDGALPTKSGTGLFQLYVNDNVTYNMVGSGGPTAWDGFAGFTLGVWKKITFDLTKVAAATNVDGTNIKTYGINMYFGSGGEVCQPSTVLIDSLTFE